MNLNRRNCHASLALLLAALLVSGVALAGDKPPEEAVSLLKKAAELSDLRSPGAPPFHLRARVRLASETGKMAEGSYDLRWVSESQWREEITFAGYKRIRVGGEGKYWQQRSTNYEPLRNYELAESLDIGSHLRLDRNESLGKIRERKRGGKLVHCVEVKGKSEISRHLCLDADSGSLVREEHTRVNPPRITAVEFSDYQTWGNKSFPRQIRVLAGNTAMVEVHVEEMSPEEGKALSDFAPLASAEEWRTCANPDRAVIKDSVAPHYPESARGARVQGTVTYYAIVEADGSLSHLTLVRTANLELERAALEAIQRWRYKPQSCNGVPVRVETLIDVTFALGL